MTLTGQAIPEYVYMEVADLIVEKIKDVTERLIVSNNVQPGYSVVAKIQFEATFPVQPEGKYAQKVSVNFITTSRRNKNDRDRDEGEFT